MVITQIGVGQHVVANQLAFTQAAAVSNHQPHVRRNTARWSQMVLAFDGPTPMLIKVIPWPSAVIRCQAGIWCFFHARSEMACSGASVSAVIQIPPAQDSAR